MRRWTGALTFGGRDRIYGNSLAKTTSRTDRPHSRYRATTENTTIAYYVVVGLGLRQVEDKIRRPSCGESGRERPGETSLEEHRVEVQERETVDSSNERASVR